MKTQDGRRLRRYAPPDRRLVLCVDSMEAPPACAMGYYSGNLPGFVQLASAMMLLRRFWDRF